MRKNPNRNASRIIALESDASTSAQSVSDTEKRTAAISQRWPTNSTAKALHNSYLSWANKSAALCATVACRPFVRHEDRMPLDRGVMNADFRPPLYLWWRFSQFKTNDKIFTILRFCVIKSEIIGCGDWVRESWEAVFNGFLSVCIIWFFCRSTRHFIRLFIIKLYCMNFLIDIIDTFFHRWLGDRNSQEARYTDCEIISCQNNLRITARNHTSMYWTCLVSYK